MLDAFDSHCHLDPEVFGGDEGVDAALERARAAGVRRFVAIGSGYGLDSAERAVRVADRHPDVWASVGLHPHDAAVFDEAAWLEVLALAAHPRVVALGEMGLDFHYDNSPREVQRTVFRRQIRDALRLRAPIIVHDRSSGGETLAILREEQAFEGAGVLWHCFSGDQAEAAAIVENGGFISIPGIVTFKKAEEMKAVAAVVPADRLLVETDSPFLAPIPHRGRRNEPAYVVHTIAEVARLRGSTPEDLAALTTDNARRFFGIG
jgi:TatD DNase family protein